MCYLPSVSPALKIEVNIFTEIAAILRQWADALERHTQRVGAEPVGPDWPESDLTELYESWMAVGHARRDVIRSQPYADTTQVRTEITAVRDGLMRISSVLERQAPPG